MTRTKHNNARALHPVQEPDPPGVTIPYPSRLNNDTGQPAADGAYDFAFGLYDTGINAGIYAGVATDIDSQVQPRDCCYDIGADELNHFVYLPLVLKNT